MKSRIQMLVALTVSAVMFSNVAVVGSGKKALSYRSHLPPVTASTTGGIPPACPTGGCPKG